MSGVLTNPDCVEGKHRACDARGWDPDREQHVPCPCACHTTSALAEKFRTEIGGIYNVVAAAVEADHQGVVQHPRACPPSHRHGETSTCYMNHKCRCSNCGAANTARVMERRKLVAYGRWVGRVPTERAIAHIDKLVAAGMPLDDIARDAGLSRVTVRRLQQADSMYSSTESQLLAVTVDRWRRRGHALVPATGTRRRVEALIWMGWTGKQIMRMAGLSDVYATTLVRAENVRVETRDRVAAVFTRLWAEPGPDTVMGRRTAARARRLGYVSALAWDDIDNDEEAAGAA